MRRMGDAGARARIPQAPADMPRGVGCRRAMGADGGIMANRRRAVRPSFWAQVAGGAAISCAISKKPMGRRRCAYKKVETPHPPILSRD